MKRKVWFGAIRLQTLLLGFVFLFGLVAAFSLDCRSLCPSQSASQNRSQAAVASQRSDDVMNSENVMNSDNVVNIVNGVTLLHGKPFFPFGFYHVSWKSTNADLLADIREIAAGGFNTIHASATNMNSYDRFLDEADRLKVYVLTEQNIGLRAAIDSFKQKPAVLGWNIADDVDNGKLSPQKLFAFHQQAKLADPHHITYISGYSNGIKQFANCADVVAMQSYPIRYENPKIFTTFDRISFTRDAIAPFQKAVYANIQAFAWQNDKKEDTRPIRIPTFAEVRNMTYQAVLAGAKGIIYYTFHDDDWHLPSHPDLWAAMKTLAPEIKAMDSLFLNGIFKKIDVGTDKVMAGLWSDRGKSLMLIVNASYDRKEVSITVPPNFKQLQPMFERLPSDPNSLLRLNGDRLSGFLKPLDVKIYQEGL